MNQLTFKNDRAAVKRPKVAGPNQRLLARRDAHTVARRTEETHDTAKLAARTQLVNALCQYLSNLGIGARFQASDFNNWLIETGRRPETIAPQATGHLFVKLKRGGFIAEIGFSSNSGSKHTGYHSTPRAVYTIKAFPQAEDLL